MAQQQRCQDELIGRRRPSQEREVRGAGKFGITGTVLAAHANNPCRNQRGRVVWSS